jgi:hypothetical protein
MFAFCFAGKPRAVLLSSVAKLVSNNRLSARERAVATSKDRQAGINP